MDALENHARIQEWIARLKVLLDEMEIDKLWFSRKAAHLDAQLHDGTRVTVIDVLSFEPFAYIVAPSGEPERRQVETTTT